MVKKTKKNGAGKKPRPRNRSKGLAWTAGIVLNEDRPIGRPIAGRVASYVPVVIEGRGPGGVQEYEDVVRFDLALELNARWLTAYSEGARESASSKVIDEAVDSLPELSDEKHHRAVSILTRFRSVDQHMLSMQGSIKRAIKAGEHVAVVAGLVRIRRVLERGRSDCECFNKHIVKFIHTNITPNKRPSMETLERTFLSPVKNNDKMSESVKADKPSEKSDFEAIADPPTLDELAIMAQYGQVNAAFTYLEAFSLYDILELFVFAGAYNLNFRRLLNEAEADTYRRMLCGGTDLEEKAELRHARAELTGRLRVVWRALPGLAYMTACQGFLENL